MLARVGRVFTTPSGSERLGDGAVGLKPWQSSTLVASDGARSTIAETGLTNGYDGSFKTQLGLCGGYQSGQLLEIGAGQDARLD